MDKLQADALRTRLAGTAYQDPRVRYDWQADAFLPGPAGGYYVTTRNSAGQLLYWRSLDQERPQAADGREV